MPRETTPDPHLGAALRQAREARHLAQETVAHASGLTVGAYGRIERGGSDPRWGTVRRIADVLETTVSELADAADALR